MTKKQELTYPYVKEREEAVDKAIEFIKTCPYKGTGIKIELEALFGREGNNRTCDSCNGSREQLCSDCQGNIPNCEGCGGRGRLICLECNGRGRSNNTANRTMDLDQCHEFIMQHISEKARNALVYSQTYHDGSVDTETTFTLRLEDVRYAVEIIRAFNAIGAEIGNGVITSGAGMHIAILNSDDCYYPGGNSLDSRRAQNFKYSMTRLMPALFFLASADHRSRHLNYRQPEVNFNSKYSAISGSHHCFEYRVFETCYRRPEAILDNLCIIANTLRYYSYRKITHPFFGKIGPVGFNDLGQGIERFYKHENNYKALMAGVKLLKPSYKTMKELRRERNFRVTLAAIRKNDKLKEATWKSEFKTEVESHANRMERLKRECKRDYEQAKADPALAGLTPTQFAARFPDFETYFKHTYYYKEHMAKRPTTEKKFIDDKRKEELRNIAVVINV